MNVVTATRLWLAGRFLRHFQFERQLGRVGCLFEQTLSGGPRVPKTCSCWRLLLPQWRNCTSVPTARSSDNRKQVEPPGNDIWTAEEDALLHSLVEQYGKQWTQIAKELNARLKSNKTRLPVSCFMRYRRTAHPAIRRNPWTREEDAAILQLYQELGPRWTEIARRLACMAQKSADPSAPPMGHFRTDKQVLDRFREKLNPERKRTPWTYTEEQQLKALVSELGPGRWSVIAAHLPGRTAMDCLLRWRRCLDPRISRAPWSPLEDEKLKELVSVHGRRWSLISQLMGNRSDIQCLQRWTYKHNPNIRRGPWTESEDRALLEAISRWNQGAATTDASQQLCIRGPKHVWVWAVRTTPELLGRSATQCRLRFKQLIRSKAIPDSRKQKAVDTHMGSS
jgi:hypothetical protein